MATAHLVCGPVGAGKSTRAQELAAAAGAVCFSLDEWMMTLYSAEMPRPLQLDWMLERTGRCETLIWRLAQQVLALGRDVVLDVGLMRRAQRDRYRELAGEAGIDLRLHVLEVNAATRRERVRARNRARTGTFTIEVDDELFDWAETWYEPPGDDER